VTPRQSRPAPGDEHTGFEELAVGYALHALEPEDEQRFTAHLPGCEDCARAVREHEETLAELAYAAPSVEPPPSLLEGIRDAVRADQRAPSLEVARRRREAADGRVDADTKGRPAASRDRSAVLVRRSWLLSAAAGVTALVLGLGVWSAMLLSDRNEQTARGDRLAQAVDALERPGARTVQLADGEGRVLAVVIGHGEQMSLVVDGLEPNPRDTIYVLWGQSADGQVLAVSAFDVREGELDVQRDLPMRQPVEQLSKLMVTHEHTRTPPDTTTQPVLAAGDV
jgi:anti-sigma-K factor RskA